MTKYITDTETVLQRRLDLVKRARTWEPRKLKIAKTTVANLAPAMLTNTDPPVATRVEVGCYNSLGVCRTTGAA